MFILDAYMTTIDRMYSFTNEPEMCIRVGLVSFTRCVLGYIIRFRNMISYFIMPVCLSTVYASIPDCVAGRIAHDNFSGYRYPYGTCRSRYARTKIIILEWMRSRK